MIAPSLEEIETAALQLAPADRVHLAERLLASLAKDDQILAAWQKEAERRADAFDRGEIAALDVDEAMVNPRLWPAYWLERR
ncbi:MAG: addiction module protein [Candidatus Accumulibacter sp. UW20]|jgi:putative addiction module component (TIGR02574 family)